MLSNMVVIGPALTPTYASILFKSTVNYESQETVETTTLVDLS